MRTIVAAVLSVVLLAPSLAFAHGYHHGGYRHHHGYHRHHYSGYHHHYRHHYSGHYYRHYGYRY